VRNGPIAKGSGSVRLRYGYTSMTVAALQSQAREIKVLKKEVVRLRRALQARDGAGGSTGFGSRR